MEASMPERSIVALFTETVADVTDLVRSEVRLARAELNEKFNRVANAGALLGAGGVLLLVALIFLLQAAVRWLAIAGMPEEWGLILIGAAAAVVGAAVLYYGINSLKGSALVPRRSVEQVRADLSVMKEQVT
jgi:hypothetical protein